MVTSAILLKMMVLARCVGFVNLANMMPVMQAWAAPHIGSHIVCRYIYFVSEGRTQLFTVMKTPTTLCTLITRMAAGHWVEVMRPPYLHSVHHHWPVSPCPVSGYPMVCCVSTLNRKAELKSATLSTQATCSALGAGPRSPAEWISTVYSLDMCWSPCCQAIRYQTMPNMNHEAK